jgi:hypothetical protein
MPSPNARSSSDGRLRLHAMSGHLPQEGLPQQAHPLQTAHPLPLLTPPGGAPVPLSGPALAQSLVSSGYLLCEELGRGGLGQVNAAMQRVFGRTVAIKQLVDGVTSDRAITKFVAEALIAALLEHPNIVPIHDLIVAADGRLQLVMKRVEGLSWGSLLSPETAYQRAYSQSMTLDDHLDILMKVCDAIAFAHGAASCTRSQARQCHGRRFRRGAGDGLGLRHGPGRGPAPSADRLRAPADLARSARPATWRPSWRSRRPTASAPTATSTAGGDPLRAAHRAAAQPRGRGR